MSHEYRSQCCCWCGCEEILESLVTLRGHTECKNYAEGDCVSAHYPRMREMDIEHAKLKTLGYSLSVLDKTFKRVFRDGAAEFNGSRAAQQYKKEFKDR